MFTYHSELFFYWMELFSWDHFSGNKIVLYYSGVHKLLFVFAVKIILYMLFLKKNENCLLFSCIIVTFWGAFLSSYAFLSLQYKNVSYPFTFGRHANFTLIITMLKYFGFFIIPSLVIILKFHSMWYLPICVPKVLAFHVLTVISFKNEQTKIPLVYLFLCTLVISIEK